MPRHDPIRTTREQRRFTYGPQPVSAAYVNGNPGPNQPLGLTGDVDGTGASTINATVVGLQGRPVSAAAPAATDVLTWDGTNWEPGPAGGGGAGSGTVTSVAAGTGITVSPSPITAAGSVSLTVPVSVANGGTGATTVAGSPYLPLVGGTLTGPGNLTVNGDVRMNPTPDYLAPHISYLVPNSVVAALAVTANPYGITGGAQTANQGAGPTCSGIGVAGAALADQTAGYGGAWGGYFEARAVAGVHASHQTQGIEIDITNRSGTTAGVPTPYNMGSLTQRMIGLIVASGGGAGANTAAETTSCAIAVTNNTARYHKGVVYADTALDTAIGSGGNGVAIEMARGQSVRWLNSGGTPDAELYSLGGGLTSIGDLAVTGTLSTATGVGSGAAIIELGGGRSAAGSALIDLHASVGSDYDLRVLRDSGVNGNAYLQNLGTGAFQLYLNGSPRLTLGNTGDLTIGGDLYVRSNPSATLAVSGAYTQLNSPDNLAQILVGGSDPSNYYWNTTHYFAARGGSPTYFTSAGGGTMCGAPTGGLKGAGTLNAVQLWANGVQVTPAAYLTASGISGMTAGQIPIAATATTITSSGNLSGDVTTAGSLATAIANNAVVTAKINNAAVTYAKIQNVAANRLLGNSTGSAAVVAEIALPLTVALGGTGATTLPLNVGPPTWGLTSTFLVTNGTTVTPLSDAGGTVGNWGGGAVIAAQVGSSAILDLVRVNGSLASPTALLNNQVVGNIAFDGSTGAGTMTANSRANIQCYTTENWSATAQGTRLDFITTPAGGTATATKMSLQNGVVVGAPTGGDKGAGTINAVGVYAAGTLLTSDARLKRDIEPVPDDCLRRVQAIEPKTFRFIEPDGAIEGGSPGFWDRRHWGFTAQDMREAIPDAVEEDAEGNLAISQGDLIACLWSSVRELSAKVQELEARGSTGSPSPV